MPMKSSNPVYILSKRKIKTNGLYLFACFSFFPSSAVERGINNLWVFKKANLNAGQNSTRVFLGENFPSVFFLEKCLLEVSFEARAGLGIFLGRFSIETGEKHGWGRNFE